MSTHSFNIVIFSSLLFIHYSGSFWASEMQKNRKMWLKKCMSPPSVLCCLEETFGPKLHPNKRSQRWHEHHKLPVNPYSHPAEVRRLLCDVAGCPSLSLPLNSWPLTGAADVRAASGTSAVSVVFSCQFSALHPHPPTHPSTRPLLSDCSWLTSKLLQLFCRNDLCRGRLAEPLGRFTLLVVWVVSVCGAGSREGREDDEREPHLSQAGITHQNSLVMRKMIFCLSHVGFTLWLCQGIRNVIKMCMIHQFHLSMFVNHKMLKCNRQIESVWSHQKANTTEISSE